jgi:1-acyl-sn-glycerol-3-phosphate acyltransferase
MHPWYRFWQIMSQAAFTAYFNIRVFGRENVPLTGPVLFVSNHQSFLDPVLCGLGLHRELDFIARDSLFHNRAFGWYIRSLNAFPIQRGKADVAAIKTVIKRLQNNRAIVVFPEGTRTDDGRIRPFKSGFELIARRARATTVPVVVDGAFDAWPRHQFLCAPGRIKIVFGPAITPEQAKKMGRDNFVALINRQLLEMQHDIRRRYHKPVYNYQHERMKK